MDENGVLQKCLRELTPVLLHLLWRDGIGANLGHGKTTAGGSSGGSEIQGPAVHRRGDPLGGPLVPDVPISYRDLELMLADRGVAIDQPP
jgi:hypothetical protein